MNFKNKILYFFSDIYTKNRKTLFFIFFLSLLISSFFLLFFKNIGPAEHQIPGTDYLSLYKPIASNILKGKEFTIEGKLVTRVPPGYPLILAMIFRISEILRINEIGLIIIFNIFISALSCCVLFLIAESIFNKKIALISSFLWMSYPFNLWFIKNPHTEVPFILFLYLSLLFYILALKKKRIEFFFFSGLFIAIASLIRPITLFLPIILTLLTFFLLKENSKKFKVLFIIIFLIGTLIPILPWEGYVFSKTGRIIPLAESGPSNIKAGLTFALLRPRQGEKKVVSNDVLELMKEIQSKKLDSGEKILYLCLQELIDKPLTFLKLIGFKIVRSWYATSRRWYEKEILIIQIFYLSFAIFGIKYGVKLYRDKIRYIILLLIIIFYFWGVTFLVHSILRYMIPVMGLVIIFSAISIEFLIKGTFKKLHLIWK